MGHAGLACIWNDFVPEVTPDALNTRNLRPRNMMG
jgi:hypothetical protein